MDVTIRHQKKKKWHPYILVLWWQQFVWSLNEWMYGWMDGCYYHAKKNGCAMMMHKFSPYPINNNNDDDDDDNDYG